MTETEALVQLTGVHKRYGETVGLDGVDLTIMPGESVAVMGPSGSGKSTLLNIVAGLDRPTSGTVRVHGEELNAMGEGALARYRRRRIGMVFQFFHLLDDLPVLDNVMLSARLIGTPYKQAKARAMGLLEELGIAARKDAYPQQLSGGERQRVGVARALMNRPALLLADEPTGALDSETGEDILRLLRARCDAGAAGVLVTHEARHAAWADRVVFLRDGVVVDESGADHADDLLESGAPA
jgi:putative ABC transport system ATP-binding protein